MCFRASRRPSGSHGHLASWTVDAPGVAVQSARDGLRTTVRVRTPSFGWIALLLDRERSAGSGAHLPSLAATTSVRADRAGRRDVERNVSG